MQRAPDHNNLKPKTERAKNNIIYTCVHVLKYIAAWKKQNNTFALLNYRTTKTDIKIKLRHIDNLYT